MHESLVSLEILKRGRGLASLIYDQVKDDAVEAMKDRLQELEKVPARPHGLKLSLSLS